ncbi:hypothetical protein C1T17_02300 [Sphingobium sp. SCG-1]|uniref:DUF6771 family protein n=1 Tax=Sphingobium sp. SCG-1 TaxID=2072936 RepID=UPI000CD6A6BC|nr:DUF6771 family protein [Sphingobium sp. SCG-1]AUW57086.1 hypothetical protein C1T17_02300 [Sphingobium sp. SCG-1]
MERISAPVIASAILTAPAWAIVGLTMQDDQMREASAETLAETIVETLNKPVPEHDPAQLVLPI